MSDLSLKDQIIASMKDAMRSRDKERLATVRLILSEIKQVEVDERIDPDDNRVVAILDRMVKQRRESIKQYEAAARQELAAREQSEILVIQQFLPAALSEAEIDDFIDRAIAESGASNIKDMGKVMNTARALLTGRADMAIVSSKVKARLS